MKAEKIKMRETCCQCGCVVELEVKKKDYEKYLSGALIQDCFPYLSAEDREIMISHICPVCWDEMFGQDEDEEYEPTAEDLKEWQDASCGRC